MIKQFNEAMELAQKFATMDEEFMIADLAMCVDQVALRLGCRSEELLLSMIPMVIGVNEQFGGAISAKDYEPI